MSRIADRSCPLTTIARRLGHVVVGVLAMRNAAHFGAPATDYNARAYAGEARTALEQLDTQLDIRRNGLRGLGEDGLLVPVGETEPFPDAPIADRVLHIHRELIHHMSGLPAARSVPAHERREPMSREIQTTLTPAPHSPRNAS